MVTNSDLQHLKYLRIGHFINAGLLFLISLFSIIYLVIGAAMLAGAFEGEKDPPPEFLGVFFIGIALILMVMFGGLAVLNLFAARALRNRSGWMFCVVMAAVNIMFSPLGLAIGVFSLIVLLRESVKQLFASGGQQISGQMPNWR